MTDRFDPYYQWLAIRDATRPPDHYRLLGLDRFESDPGVIGTAADRQMVHLRTFQHGPHAAESQQLLNEVAAARLCLLDPLRKREYDEGLRAASPPSPPPTSNPSTAAYDKVVTPAAVPTPPRAVTPPITAASPTPPRVAIQPTISTVALRPPGRGHRDRVARFPIGAFIGVSLLIIGGAIAWSVSQYVSRTRLARRVAQAPSAADQTSLPSATNDAGQVDGATTGSELTTTNAQPTASGTDSPSASTTPAASPSVPSQGASAVTTGQATTSQDTARSTPADTPRPSPSTPPRTAGWDATILEITPRPATFPQGSPLGQILGLLAQRKPELVDDQFRKWRKEPTAPLDDDTLANAQLIYEGVDAFWRVTREAVAHLRPGDRLQFGPWPVQVTEVQAKQLELETATGQRHRFDLDPSRMHRELAIALVAHHWRDSPPIAWRAIALFLSIDHQGDPSRATPFRQRAEAHGLDMDFLDATLRALGVSSGATS